MNRKSTRACQRAIDGVCTITLRPPNSGSNNVFPFKEISKLQSNKVCYKVPLCENFQLQSCTTTIPLSSGP